VHPQQAADDQRRRENGYRQHEADDFANQHDATL
jgi:hypothetical protein